MVWWYDWRYAKRQRRQLKILNIGHGTLMVSDFHQKSEAIFSNIIATIQVTKMLQKVQNYHMLIYHATINQRSRQTPCLNRRLQEDKGDTTFIQHWVGLTRWPFRNQCKWWRFQCGLRVGVGIDCLTGGNFQFDYPRGRYCKSGCPDVGLLCKKRRKIGFGQNWQFYNPLKNRKKRVTTSQGWVSDWSVLSLQYTYTMSRSHSAQTFCPGGNWGLLGAGLFWGAVTCLRPATPLLGAVTTPASGST